MFVVVDYEIGDVRFVSEKVFKKLQQYIDNFVGHELDRHTSEKDDWFTLVLKGKVEVGESKFVCGMVYAWCIQNSVEIEMNFTPMGVQ